MGRKKQSVSNMAKIQSEVEKVLGEPLIKSSEDTPPNSQPSTQPIDAQTEKKHTPAPSVSSSNGFIRRLPFTPHPKLDPRAAAALIGVSNTSMLHVLANVHKHLIKDMSDGSLTDVNAKEILDNKTEDFVFNVVESLIEFSRKSYISECFNNFKTSNMCMGYIENLLKENNISLEMKITPENYFYDEIITTLTDCPFLPQMMDFDDHEVLKEIIKSMRTNTSFVSCETIKKRRIKTF